MRLILEVRLLIEGDLYWRKYGNGKVAEFAVKKISVVFPIFGYREKSSSKVKLKEPITSAMTFHPLFFGKSALRRPSAQKKSGWNVMADVLSSFKLTLVQFQNEAT